VFDPGGDPAFLFHRFWFEFMDSLQVAVAQVRQRHLAL
jgi:hypothetical protein